MTSSGRRWAFLIGVVIAFMLPKRVECGYPGGLCERAIGSTAGGAGKGCYYEVEPLGFYAIEYLAGRDIGFAYSSGDDCR
jgi:hypothetical protein